MGHGIKYQRNASKTNLRFNFTSVIIPNLKNKQMTAHAGKYAGKGGCLFTAGKNANLYNHYGNRCRGKLLEIYLPQEPFLGIYPKVSVWFIASIFAIARKQKQPRCPSTDALMHGQ